MIQLAWPVQPPIFVLQEFGDNTTGDPNFYSRFGLPGHEGIDFRVKPRDLILSAAAGTILAINVPGHGGIPKDHPYGNHAILRHDVDGHIWQTQYCHLAFVYSWSIGHAIGVGEVLGFAGNTGNVVHDAQMDGVHLHFMLRRVGATAAREFQRLPNGKLVIYPHDLVNPRPYLPQ